jgi:hypothetical protein
MRTAPVLLGACRQRRSAGAGMVMTNPIVVVGAGRYGGTDAKPIEPVAEEVQTPNA